MTAHLTPIVDGPESAETLVFIQGWPDDASVWDAQVALLAARHRCVRTTMPNFDGRRTARWGHDTDELVAALARLVREVSPHAPVTLILHDWGCYWGHHLHHRHPDLAWRVASLDVAPHVEPGLGAMLGIIAYQWWLIGAFALDGRAGDWMTRSLAAAMGAPMARERITSWMNYPYRNGWRDILSGRARRQAEGYWPTVPLLFVYGKQKPFPFHSEKWLRHVRDTGGTVVGLDCGHWVQRHPALGDTLATWLERSRP